MTAEIRPKRFQVADIGFGFVVHDTGVKADYNFEAGREQDHPSTNVLNSVRVSGPFTTRAQAQADADERNAANP
jgi:hypothetical protein